MCFERVKVQVGVQSCVFVRVVHMWFICGSCAYTSCVSVCLQVCACVSVCACACVCACCVSGQVRSRSGLLLGRSLGP